MTPEESRSSNRNLLVPLGAALAAGLLFGFLLYHFRLFYHDDAFISLRYARNFVEGHGLCFNPGERVEGYTNFLFILALLGAHAFGWDWIEGSRMIGTASAVILLLVFLIRGLARRKTSAVAAFAPLLFLASSAPLAIWSLGGLETVFFSLLLLFGLLPLLSHRPGPMAYGASGFLLGLAVLARPEGLLFLAGGALHALIADKGPEKRFKKLIYLCLGGLSLLLPYCLWKLSYYGQLLPNTFLAKSGIGLTGMGRGVSYAALFAGANLAALFASSRALKIPARRSPALFLSLLILAYTGYVIWAGGDHMPALRFFVPLLPLLAILAGWGLEGVERPESGHARTRQAAVLLILILAFNLTAALLLFKRAEVRDPAAFVGEKTGRFMKAHFNSGTVVALNTAGSAPFYSGLKTIDMLGITDPVVAKRKAPPQILPWQKLPGHRKGDGAYVLSRRPDIIILGPAEGDTSAWFLSDAEILADSLFRRDYRYRFAWIQANEPEAGAYAPFRDGRMMFQYYERDSTGTEDMRPVIEQIKNGMAN